MYRSAVENENSRLFFITTGVAYILYTLIGLKVDFLIAAMTLPAMILGIAFFYYLIKMPVLGVAIMIIGTALDSFGRIGGMPITVFHFGVVLTLFALAVRAFYEKGFQFAKTTFDIPLLLFLLWISASLLYSPNRADGLIHFGRVVALVIVMYAVIHAVDRPFGVYLSLGSQVLSALVLALIAIKSIVGTSSTLIEIAAGALGIFGRVGVTFENPNYFATFLMIAVAISASLFLNGSLPVYVKLILLGIAGAILFALVGTFSRAAWLAVFFGLIVVAYYSKYRKTIFITGGILTVAVIVFLGQSALFRTFVVRLSSITQTSGDPSNSTRIFLALGGLEMFIKSFLMGVGFRGFPEVYIHSYRPAVQGLYDVVESHTLPVEILAELGIIGFVLFGVIMGRFFKFAVSSIKSISHTMLRACQIGVVASFVGYLFTAMLSPGTLEGNYFWIGIGLTFAIHRVANRAEPGTTQTNNPPVTSSL